MTGATVLSDAFEIKGVSRGSLDFSQTEHNYDIEFEKEKAEQAAAGTLGRAFYGGGSRPVSRPPKRPSIRRRPKRGVSIPTPLPPRKRKKTKTGRKAKPRSKKSKRKTRPKATKRASKASKKRGGVKNKLKLTCRGGLF